MTDEKQNAHSINLSLTPERAAEAFLREMLIEHFCRSSKHADVKELVITHGAEDRMSGRVLWQTLLIMLSRRLRSPAGINTSMYILECEDGPHLFSVRYERSKVIFERSDLPPVLFACQVE